AANLAEILGQAGDQGYVEQVVGADLGRAEICRGTAAGAYRDQNVAFWWRPTSDRGLYFGAERREPARGSVPLQRRGPSAGVLAARGRLQADHPVAGESVVVRPCGLYRVHERGLRSHPVEIPIRAGLPGRAARSWSLVPNVLPDGNVAESCAILHAGVCGFG